MMKLPSQSLRFIALLTCVVAMTACNKEREIAGAQIKLHTGESVFQMDQLIPDLAGLTMEYDLGYCITIPNPDIDLSFGIDKMWMEANHSEYSIPLSGLSIPSTFADPLELPFSFSDSLNLFNLHWPDGLESMDYAHVSGTMTLHFTFPEGLPFEKMFLHPFLSMIYLPNYLVIDDLNISGGSVHFENKNGQSRLYFSNPGRWIPREGLDIKMGVKGIRPDGLGLQEDGNRCLRGAFSGYGVFLLYPEDARGDAEGSFNGSLDVSVSFSDLSFDYLHCKLDPDRFEREKTVKVPFPRFKDERIDHFANPCLYVDYQLPKLSDLYYVTQRFFSVKGQETYSTSAISIPYYSHKAFYMAKDDHIGHDGMTVRSYPELSEVFRVLPDSLGVCFSCDALSEYIYPGEVSHFHFASKWRIPLFLTGTYWGKTCNSVEYSIRDLVENAVPGTEITVTVWYDNQQPFAVKCTPVFVDSEGAQHELPDEAFIIEGGDIYSMRTGTFAAHRIAGDKVKDETFFLKLEFGECSDFRLRPNQTLRLGIESIKKTMYVD